jgi:arylformamidase
MKNQLEKKLLDLSHTIHEGLITYKGLPAPVICDYLSRADSRKFYAEGTEFQIGKIELISNTGTYIDCPFHRYADGEDLSQVHLDRFACLKGITVHFDYERDGLAIGKESFEKIDLSTKAVLVNTNWSDHWGTDQYFENHPFLTSQAAEFLVQAGVKLVGIDSYNIDDTRTRERPVHTILLGKGILIVEHMTNLRQVPDSGFEFSAVPPKIVGMGTFPVRAFCRLE